MSWFSLWLKKGFKITFRRDWPGDKKLAHPPVWPKTITKESVEKEIEDSLHKGG
jgi:hypothetical protein